MANRIDVTDLLLRDHRLIDGLAEQLDAADDPAEIRRLYVRIGEELTAARGRRARSRVPSVQGGPGKCR